MIWVVRFDIIETLGWTYVPTVADNEAEAIGKAERMIPFETEWRDVVVDLYSTVSSSDNEQMREWLNDRLADYWREALSTNRGGPEVFHAVIDHYVETIKVLWEV